MKHEAKVHELDPVAVSIGDRQRTDLGDLSDLKDSIEDVGQIQPIVVEATVAEDGVTEVLSLVAGHRRLEACRELERRVKAVLWSDLDDYQRQKVEFDENVARKQLTWDERAVAEKRLVEIAKNHGVSMRSVARELEVSPGALSDRVALAEAVEVFPQLKECKSASEAAKTLKNLVHKELTDEVLRREKERADREIKGAEEIDLSIFQDRMAVGEFGVASKSIEDGSADIVIFDPPFGIELDKVKQSEYAKSASHHSGGIYKDTREAFSTLFPLWMAEISRLMSPNSHLWVFFGIEWYQFVCDNLKEVGLKYDKIPCIWFKQGSAGQTNNPNYYAGRVYEAFIFAWKGEQPLQRRGLPNVIEAPPIPASDKIHETEKPLLLLDNIIRRSYWPGAVVMDPMYGSGSTFRALMGLGTTKFFGWELDEDKAGRAQLKSLAHAHQLMKVKGFSLTHYDEVTRTKDLEYQPGDRVKWKDNLGEIHEGTVKHQDPEYAKLLVYPDEKGYQRNPKYHPDQKEPPADHTAVIPIKQLLTD